MITNGMVEAACHRMFTVQQWSQAMKHDPNGAWVQAQRQWMRSVLEAAHNAREREYQG